MMRKTISLTLLLCCLLSAASAGAEMLAIDIDIAADWGTPALLEEHGIQLTIPSAWQPETPQGRLIYAAGNFDAGEMMGLTLDAVQPDATLEQASEALLSIVGTTGVEQFVINGTPYIIYETPDEDVFGAFTLLEDRSALLHFVFTPLTEAMQDEALLVLARLQRIE